MNQPFTPGGQIPWSIGKILEKWALATPHKPALIIEGESTSYAELNQYSNRIAQYFIEQGLKKGQRVAGMTENSLEAVATYFACAKVGLICVPLNNRLMSDELYYQLENSGTAALVFEAKYAAQLASVVQRLKLTPSRALCISDAEEPHDWSSSFTYQIAKQRDQNPHLSDPVVLDDALAIIYTSGTTGAPKGAVVSHLQTYFKCLQNFLYMDMREDDRYMTHMPLFHSAGLFVSLTPVICRGATLITSRKFDVPRFINDAKHYQVTVLGGTTTMLKMILRDYDKRSNAFESVRVAIGGGERTPLSLIEECQQVGLNIQMGFGQTENSFMALQRAEHVVDHFGSVGRAGFMTEVWIEDERGDVATPGEHGAIVATGPTVMSGYWGMPERTRETIIDGKLKTGDIGYMDEDQHLYLVDREKDMYRSGAENVYPAEIEKLLMDHPKVDNVAIIGVPDEQWGETGKAFIVTRKGEKADSTELLAFLDGKLARYKLPKHFEFLDQLPLTASGKVQKVLLKEKEGVKLNK